MKNKHKYAILALLILSFLVRFLKLGQDPTFISDEASIGYNAFSILKTGRDEWGQFLPLTFKAFGEHKLPLYIYASTLPIRIFGINEFSTRFVSAFFGSLSIILIFLVSQKLFSKDKKILPFLIAFLFAINPWHVQTSRLALEANLALFLFLLGFNFFLKEKLVPAAVFFGLTFYTYNGFRLFIPLFLLLSLVFKKRTLSQIKKPAVIFLIILFPLIISGFQGSPERLFKTAIFRDPGLVSRIEEKRGQCQTKLPPLLCRLAFNRPLVYTSEIFKNYLSHFGPRFLTKGAGLAQYGLPNFGIIYVLETPFLLIGFWQFLKKDSLKKNLLPWLLAAPVANSLTGPAHPLRSQVLLPLFPILAGLGVYFCFQTLSKWKKEFLLIFASLALFSLFSFLYQYFWIYPTQTGSIWQSGYKPLFEYLGVASPSQAVISKFYGEPHIFDLFYQARLDAFEPRLIYESSPPFLIRNDREDNWVNVDRFGSTFYWEKKDHPLLSEFLLEKGGDPNFFTLIALPFQEYLAGKEPDEVIFYSNGEIAFKIYRLNQPW
jgi:4-amino-4-deoxy-L-arabinose transferase-like glycosyltransferase